MALRRRFSDEDDQQLEIKFNPMADEYKQFIVNNTHKLYTLHYGSYNNIQRIESEFIGSKNLSYSDYCDFKRLTKDITDWVKVMLPKPAKNNSIEITPDEFDESPEDKDTRLEKSNLMVEQRVKQKNYDKLITKWNKML